MSYTKGKWDWTEKEDMSHGIGITGDGAVFATVEGTDKEAKDTACLIAAAPYLLGAIEYTLQRHQEGGFHEDRADFDDCKEKLLSAKVKAIRGFNGERI